VNLEVERSGFNWRVGISYLYLEVMDNKYLIYLSFFYLEVMDNKYLI